MKWYKWKFWIFAWKLNAGGMVITECDFAWRSLFNSKLSIKWPGNHHDRCEYVTTSGLMFIKCLRCGAESIPWRVRPDQAKDWRDRHPNEIEMVEGFYKDRLLRSSCGPII